MINSDLEPKTGKSFSGLRAFAMCMALASLAFALGTLNVAQGQIQTRTYARTDIERFIRDVEQSAREFQNDFDTWLDRSQVDGQRREDVYNRQVQELTNGLRSLRQNFNRNNDWWLARNDMQRVLAAATNVNTIMASREVRGGLNRQWGALRRNLNQLADAFNLPQVGTAFGGIQTYPTYGGNSRSCSITGTFRGWTNTGEAELSFSSNGSATARSLSNNAVYTGRCAGDVVYFDWGAFNLVRDGNRGISTVEIGNTRNRTSYRRVSGSGSGYPGDTSNYPSFPNSNVPSWAVGVFRGVTNDGESEITISPNGVATARSLSTGQLHNGQYSNGVLTFDWGSFRLDQDGNGIRTTEVRNSRNRTSYQRVSGYPGTGGTGYPSNYPTYPGTNSSVPNWVVGTFRGMTNNGESELTFDSNGGVTVRALNTNQVYYGRYNNDVMTVDWGTYRIVREGRGIATEEIGGQGTRTSYRRVN